MTREIFYEEQVCGTATLSQEGLYQILDCCCDLVSGEILRCYGLLEGESILLGVMMPQDGKLILQKRMALSGWKPWADCQLILAREPPQWAPAMPALEVEEPKKNGWQPWEGHLYNHYIKEGMATTVGDTTIVAMPYSMEESFAYMDLFCMLTPKTIGGKMYLTCELPKVTGG